MTLKLYNTLTRKTQAFKPRADNKVQFFVCGPTVYDFSHIGHAKSYVQFDVIAKYLRYKGYNVFYLQNITDIDDKIIDRANENKKDPLELAREFEKEYYDDMKALGVDSVDKYAPATNYIAEIIDQIKRLIQKGFAYEIDDGVYFNISKKKDYGKLSKQDLEALKVNRIEPNPQKKNQGDFSLWKKQKPGEPAWESHFGKGRPGWHIEDTAITEKEFGPQYDIHGGGIDLIFPHHEAEIAQIESVSGKKPLVKYWLHNGFLRVGGEKMSKSLGNFTTIREARSKWNNLALRYFFLSTHYRSPIDYTEQSLEGAKNSLQRIWDFMLKLDEINSEQDNSKITKLIERVRKRFEKSMDNDIDISGALASIFDFVKEINLLISKNKLSKKDAELIKNQMNEFDKVLGILKKEEELSSEIKLLINQREDARKNKEWKKSDELRDELNKKGYVIEDTAQGPRVKKS